MIIENLDGMVILRAEGNNKITNEGRDFFTDIIYLGKNDTPDNYEEVPREIWKYMVKEEKPDITELQAQNTDINENIDILMMALANSDEQNSSAIDAILLAIDDLYRMLEPLINGGGE